MSQLLRPPHLAHGSVGNKLRPYGLDDAQSVDVPCVILGKVYSRQGAVIPDESLEASAALHEHGVASLRGHLKAEGDEQTGSQSYIPPDPKDDKALHTALDLIRGIQKNSAYPPNPKAAVPN